MKELAVLTNFGQQKLRGHEALPLGPGGRLADRIVSALVRAAYMQQPWDSGAREIVEKELQSGLPVSVNFQASRVGA